MGEVAMLAVWAVTLKQEVLANGNFVGVVDIAAAWALVANTWENPVSNTTR